MFLLNVCTFNKREKASDSSLRTACTQDFLAKLFSDCDGRE